MLALSKMLTPPISIDSIQLTQVPPPKAAKRAPPIGYDMRTLRKQLEFLREEITDRAQTQALLYEQNDQLWKYLHELLNIHNQNATTLFHRANRRFKLSRNFKAWKKLTKDNLTEKITLHQVEIVNAYRMKKLIFSAWKSCTTFIETPTHSVLYYFKLETTAMFMRKRRIFHAWRKVAISEREELEALSETWPRKVMSRFLQNWLEADGRKSENGCEEKVGCFDLDKTSQETLLASLDTQDTQTKQHKRNGITNTWTSGGHAHNSPLSKYGSVSVRMPCLTTYIGWWIPFGNYGEGSRRRMNSTSKLPITTGAFGLEGVLGNVPALKEKKNIQQLKEYKLEFQRLQSLDALSRLSLLDKLKERDRNDRVLGEMEEFTRELRDTLPTFTGSRKLFPTFEIASRNLKKKSDTYNKT
eukprot:gene24876-33366_t